MRKKAFLWFQIVYAYCISLMCSVSNIAKGKRMLLSACLSLMSLQDFLNWSSPFYFSTTHPFSNTFWILPGIYVKFICLSLRKPKTEILFDIFTPMFSAPTMVLPSFYLEFFKGQHFEKWDQELFVFFHFEALNQCNYLFINSMFSTCIENFLKSSAQR